MPMLRPEDRAELLVPVGICFVCIQVLTRGYCRQCDAFYFYGCACEKLHGHEGHRTYENFEPQPWHP